MATVEFPVEAVLKATLEGIMAMTELRDQDREAEITKLMSYRWLGFIPSTRSREAALSIYEQYPGMGQWSIKTRTERKYQHRIERMEVIRKLAKRAATFGVPVITLDEREASWIGL